MSQSKAVGDAESALSHAERREKERFPCVGFAEVILDDFAFLFRGSIRDLSATGCYIQSSARLALPRGTQVELRFLVKSVELRLPARIMIIRAGTGAGFEFLPIEAEMRSRLNNLIARLANPAVSEEALPEAQTSEAREVFSPSRDLWH